MLFFKNIFTIWYFCPFWDTLVHFEQILSAQAPLCKTLLFLETFLVNLIKSQRIFAIICYYLKYLVSKFRILVHKRTILAWKLIFCSTLSTFRPKCPKTNGNNQTKNKLSLIIYFGNPKFWKCLGYNYDWLSIPPPDENLLFRTFVHCHPLFYHVITA